MSKMSDVAIAHDQFHTLGGAERVACEIARTFDAPIFAMRVDDGVPPADVEVIELADGVGSWLMHQHYLAQDAYQMLAWQHVDELYQYDTVIQTKNNPAWFVPSADHQTVVRYCHSTPRGLYDLYRHRGGDLLGDAMKTVQRLLYQQTTSYADRWLCNSETVKRRVRMYADPASATVDVVHPPVDTGGITPQAGETGDYFLYVGRLAGNKRIELLREVARSINQRVVVAGDGPEKATLMADQPPNLEYVGYVSEGEKARRLAEAKATLFLAEHEDFGIVPVESMAAGTPVIGVNEGFTKHQIDDGENGYLCRPTVDSVTSTIDAFEIQGVQWTEREIAAFAEQFSRERFRDEMREHVAAAHEDSRVTPGLRSPAEVDNAR